jgi:hypothetical protein
MLHQFLNSHKTLAKSIFILLIFSSFQTLSYASTSTNDTLKVNRYRGIVIDSKSKKPLVFATLTINGTNISTITNTQGRFLLKVPKEYLSNQITISFLGYTSKVLNLSYLDKNKSIIKLDTHIEELSEVKIVTKDALALVQEALKRRGENYFIEDTKMTAFYRETIKKRRTYVSLSEAVVEIHKQPYNTTKNDLLKLYKSRKSTDYKKLDTVALKLRGGPFSAIHLDVMKNPELIFTEDIATTYTFTFDSSTKIDNRPIYVVNFKQKPSISEPYYNGKLYIDAQSLAVTSAKFYLNLDNPEKAARLFIIKKPRKAEVLPIQANYQVDFREKNGKWYYGYSRIELGFKIDYDTKLFNSVYYTTIEMAITDWEKINNDRPIKLKDRLRSSVIMSDEASGFQDPEFWGEYNVIEPEKPIESAIKKIQKQLKKIDN